MKILYEVAPARYGEGPRKRYRWKWRALRDAKRRKNGTIVWRVSCFDIGLAHYEMVQEFHKD
jgi:hypothetical protein